MCFDHVRSAEIVTPRHFVCCTHVMGDPSTEMRDENEFGVVREWHFCQRVHEHDEEQGTEYGALGDSRGNLAGDRCEPVDDSALLSVREVALKRAPCV